MKQQKINELEEKITTIEKQSVFIASLFISYVLATSCCISHKPFQREREMLLLVFRKFLDQLFQNSLFMKHVQETTCTPNLVKTGLMVCPDQTHCFLFAGYCLVGKILGKKGH